MHLLEADLASAALVLPASAEAAQSEQEIRIASYAYASDPIDTPASTYWLPRILGGVTVEQDALGALGAGGVVALTAAELVVSDQDGWARDLARYSGADGREVDLRVAEVVDPRASDFGTPLRSTVTAWRGRVRRVDRAPNRRARIALDDLTVLLQTPLQQARYTGAGGLGGPAALADRPQPLALGQLFNVAPVDLGLVNLGDGPLPTYQSHWRAVAGHDAVRIRGVEQTEVFTAPGVAQWRDWPALGLVQIGSTPDGPVTVDVQGDADGYPNTTGAILWRLLSVHGPQLAESGRDAEAWGFAEADLGGTVGFWQPAEDITALEACERILAGCGAVLVGGRDARLRLFDPFANVSDIQIDLVPGMIAAEPVPVPLPAALVPAPREVLIEWGRNHAPLAEIGTAAPASLRQRLVDAAPPVASVASATITARVRAQRSLRLPGLYADAAGAQARAAIISAWLEGGGRAWQVPTDRYPDANLGDWARVTYPMAGLEAGFAGVVIAMAEDLDRRRRTLTILGAGG
jgi:hypothetical protein